MAWSIQYPETPLNSAQRAEIWLRRGRPGGAKNTTHTLAGHVSGRSVDSAEPVTHMRDMKEREFT